MKIGDIMSERVVCISQMEPVSAAARLMTRCNLGSLPVCDDAGRLRGIVTDRDIVTRCVAADMDAGDTKVREVMSRGIQSCAKDDDVQQAASVMAEQQIRRLPVLEDGKLVGMLSLSDLARRSRLSMEAAEALGKISSNVRHG